MDQEIPDYDMDSEDEQWLTKQAKKMEVTPLKFENMMDRLEKGSGQTVSASLAVPLLAVRVPQIPGFSCSILYYYLWQYTAS